MTNGSEGITQRYGLNGFYPSRWLTRPRLMTPQELRAGSTIVTKFERGLSSVKIILPNKGPTVTYTITPNGIPWPIRVSNGTAHVSGGKARYALNAARQVLVSARQELGIGLPELSERGLALRQASPVISQRLNFSSMSASRSAARFAPFLSKAGVTRSLVRLGAIPAALAIGAVAIQIGLASYAAGKENGRYFSWDRYVARATGEAVGYLAALGIGSLGGPVGTILSVGLGLDANFRQRGGELAEKIYTKSPALFAAKPHAYA